jgi:hypothetical protein
MKECWSEGALRAYLDRELPPEDMERVAAHLEVCSECGDHWTELAGRAARVSALMDALPVPDRTVSISRVSRKAGTTKWRWAGAAGALAAGLVLGIVALPKRQPVAPVALPPVSWSAQQAGPSNPAPSASTEVVPPMRVMNAAAGRVRPSQPMKRNRPQDAPANDDFVSLDDEPISTGVVLRVELGPKGIPADVIFGSDGRPHAIRLVNSKSNH